MLRFSRQLLPVALLLGAFAWGGCSDDDPAGPTGPRDLSGDWVMVSMVTAKVECSGGSPMDSEVDEFTISQDGTDLSIDFGDFVATGTAVDDHVDATGTLPAGEDIDIALDFDGDNLSGTLSIAGEGCSEERSALASRRGDDANMSGFWEFDLTVVGEGGCPSIVDYTDCFQVIQDGSDLLVVDDELGNLVGEVTGNVARIDRDNANERTTMIFFISDDENSTSGTAVRIEPESGCRTDLTFTGATRVEPCAESEDD